MITALIITVVMHRPSVTQEREGAPRELCNVASIGSVPA